MEVTPVDVRQSTLTPRAAIAGVTLDDKYTRDSGRIYISGVQALVRLPLVQRRRDLAEGLKTGGFISGYRGSPLAQYDEALWKARQHLDAHHVKFQPGVNEELAATAVWGSQQLTLIGEAAYDGVFALWYGKGPGVDRCGDVFKHMNYGGTSRHGGVLLVAADDHVGHSSTLAHQSEHAFSAAMIPVLYPSNVEDYLTLGLHGWAMSRFSGCAVGLKAVADTVESSATIDADPFSTITRFPTDFVMPQGGLNTRLFNGTLDVQVRAQEALMHDYKIFAALAYARLNKLNRVTIDSPRARFGIVAPGKSYADVVEALDELGIDEGVARQIGVRLYKVSMPWPLEPQGVRAFADGLEEILVVEEKRQIVEYQLKEQLYDWRGAVRPRVIGRFDEKGEWATPRGEWLLSGKGELSVARIAQVIAGRIARFHSSQRISERLRFLAEKEAAPARAFKAPPRPPYYCSGCPHNSSTKVPPGSLALAGIGCHVMAPSIFPEHNRTITHMGGEGAPWIGAAPFSKVPHVFANLGDGTYFHSGSLAIRAAVAANVNITYKLLYNDAVAMTGGQPIQGSIRQVAWQLSAEGVKRVAIVAENMERYALTKEFPAITTFDDRRDLMKVQGELRDTEGVTVLIFDQVCAAEKRRRRKRGQFPDPDKRLFINDAVCEGCGDCGEQSNCVSIQPLETSTGRKRIIDQSSCNKDFSCAKGFCPSFVTVIGGKVRNRTVGDAEPNDLGSLPPVSIPACAKTYNILINGIGGTGVITIGALLGMAAHLEGKSVSVLDMTGMSQKNGAVTSHVRVSERPKDYPARIPYGEADLILGCDILTSAARDAVSKAQAGRTYAVVNTHQQTTGAFTKNPDWQFPGEEMVQVIRDAVGERAIFIDATAIATALLGDSIATNLFMLGLSYQKGLIPIGEVAINHAIELNGVAVGANKKAFEWGRHAAVDEAKVRSIALPNNAVFQVFAPSLDQEIDDRVRELTSYQNAAYAKQYLDLVARVRATEQPLAKGARLTSAVSRYYFKLMAYKDEYEVARLYTDGHFKERLAAQFDGEVSLRFSLAPPLFAKRDADGHLIKREYGPWIWYAFCVLTKLKFLRGTLFDPFGYAAERRIERQLIKEYRGDVEELLANLNERNLAEAAEFASWPEYVRGYGHVKDASLSAIRTKRTPKQKREKGRVLDRRTG